jgi:hypothetical protein
MNALLPESPVVLSVACTLEAALASYDPFASSAARAHWLHMRSTRGF